MVYSIPPQTQSEYCVTLKLVDSFSETEFVEVVSRKLRSPQEVPRCKQLMAFKTR